MPVSESQQQLQTIQIEATNLDIDPRKVPRCESQHSLPSANDYKQDSRNNLLNRPYAKKTWVNQVLESKDTFGFIEKYGKPRAVRVRTGRGSIRPSPAVVASESTLDVFTGRSKESLPDLPLDESSPENISQILLEMPQFLDKMV